MTPRRRKTTCANPDCRRPCYPEARGLCDGCLRDYRARHDRKRVGTRERDHYDTAWRARSKREIRAHVALHGYLCPGYTGSDKPCPGADRHRNPLTLDHVEARNDENTQVLCRVCNARKGAKKGRP